jgi:hypothetical protein
MLVSKLYAEDHLSKPLGESWLGMSERLFRFDKWNVCRVISDWPTVYANVRRLLGERQADAQIGVYDGNFEREIRAMNLSHLRLHYC